MFGAATEGQSENSVWGSYKGANSGTKGKALLSLSEPLQSGLGAGKLFAIEQKGLENVFLAQARV